MMGLYFLFLAVVWLAIVCAIALFVAKVVPAAKWRTPVGVLTALALFPLPKIDEVVGGIQFKKLCATNATIDVRRDKAKGRVVYLADVPTKYVEGAWVPIREIEYRFVDVRTRETLISYKTFNAGPGYLRLGEGPILFRGYCAPGGHVNQRELLKGLGVTAIKRSEVREGKSQ